MAKRSELARVLAHIDAEIDQLQRAKAHILEVQAQTQRRRQKPPTAAKRMREDRARDQQTAE